MSILILYLYPYLSTQHFVIAHLTNNAVQLPIFCIQFQFSVLVFAFLFEKILQKFSLEN